MNALSFPDKTSPNKVISVFHLSGKSNSHFTEELRKAGFRVLKID
jgi:hypothetical protein